MSMPVLYILYCLNMYFIVLQITVPWNEQFRTEQRALVSTAMAFIHRSSVNAVEKLHSHQRNHYVFFTPLTFMEFAHIFKVISAFIGREEKVIEKI